MHNRQRQVVEITICAKTQIILQEEWTISYEGLLRMLERYAFNVSSQNRSTLNENLETIQYS